MNEEYHEEAVPEAVATEEQGALKRTAYIVRIAGVVVVIAIVALFARKVLAPEKMLPPATPLPPGVPGKVVGSVVQEEGTGKEFISNQVIIGFAAGVSETDAAELIKSIDGTVLERFTNVPLFKVEVPDSKDGSIAKGTVAQLLKDKRVDDATLNYLVVLEQSATTTRTK